MRGASGRHSLRTTACRVALRILLCAAMGVPVWAAQCQAGLEAIQRRDWVAAEAALKQCLSVTPHLETFLLLCGVYQMQGNAEALEKTAVEGLAKFPNEKRFYLTAGTYAGRAQRWEKAIEILDAGLARWPEDEKLQSLAAGAHAGLGEQKLDAGEHAAAAKHLERAAKLDPSDVRIQLNLGRALHNMHRNIEALEVFDRVLARDPRAPQLRFHRGLVLYTLGEFERALHELDLETTANPGYAPARLVRGLTLAAQGEWERALPDLEAAAEGMPQHAPAQYALARCLLKLGRTEAAEARLRKTIELDAGDPAPLNALVRLLLQSGRKEEAAPLAARAAQLSKTQRSASAGEIQFERARRP